MNCLHSEDRLDCEAGNGLLHASEAQQTIQEPSSATCSAPGIWQDLRLQSSAAKKAKRVSFNSLSIQRLRYPEVAHEWLDDGRLLQLLPFSILGNSGSDANRC